MVCKRQVSKIAQMLLADDEKILIQDTYDRRV